MTFSLLYSADATPQPEDWVIVVQQGKLLSVNDTLLHRFSSIHQCQPISNSILFLGTWCATPCFVVSAVAAADSDSPGEFQSLRQFLDLVDDSLFALASRATQLAHWRELHQFCGRCGSPTQLHQQELMMVCGACAATFYPTISPCVIGIVTRGKRCLLAHNERFKEGVYSVLAGFIEPGESAEQAFAREVYEEVGLRIKNIRYVESQAWPFPSQLMLGFSAEYDSGDIQVDNVEILHADWFGAEQLPIIPPSRTISGKLIRDFFGDSFE